MARQFLVEHYRPGARAAEFHEWACLVAQAAAELASEGTLVSYLGATILPLDEALLCLFEAHSEVAVRAAYERAGLSFERISPALRGPTRHRKRIDQPCTSEAIT